MARLRREKNERQRRTTVLAVLGMVVGLLGIGVQVLPASATLPGTTFDAGDGNESVDLGIPPETDWASPGLNVETQGDASGDGDDSLNASNDSVDPKVGVGNIQPNKSDLTSIRMASEKVGSQDFLYLAWNRVPDPAGSVSVDFELNKQAQPAVPAAGTVWALNRTTDDILLTFELVGGGTTAEISLRRWVTTGPKALCDSNPSTPCWGKPTLLTEFTSPAAEGSVNAGADITFGEMAVNLGGAGIFTTGQCTSFASVYAKSRSSGEGFSSQVSDLVAPLTKSVSNCGGITVTKQVTGPTLAGDATSFQFNVSCATVDLDPVTAGVQTTKTLTLAAGASATVPNIPPTATCTVTETAPAPDNFTTTYQVTGELAGSGREATVSNVPLTGKTVTFTNARQTGGLTVTKTSTGGVGTFLFAVDCSDGTAHDRTGADKVSITTTASGTSVTSPAITGIPTGTVCTVTEDANSLYSTVVTPSNGQRTIETTNRDVSFANTRLTGSLVIAKTTTGGTGTFLFTVECDGTQFDRKGADKVSITGTDTHTISDIPTGTSCTVTEDADPLFTSTRTPTGGTVTIDANGETVSFTNVRKTGTLTVTKTTSGGTGTFRFEVECDGTAYDRKGDDRLTVVGSGQATVTGIPTGTVCTVTETTDALFTSTRTPTNGTVTMDVDGETVSFTNVRNTGVLTVSKTTTGGSGTFRFEVDCSDDAFDRTGNDRLTVVDSGSATVTGIPTGTTCTVTETADPLFTSTRTPVNGAVTIDVDGETVAFTNVRKTGALTITKTTTGGDGSFSFAVDCSDDAFDRAAVVVGTTGGSGSGVVAGIPTTTTCTVTETVPAGWAAVGGTTRNVTIDTDGETAAFANRKLTSGIDVTKAASAPVVRSGTGVTYTYVVTNTGENPLLDVRVVDDKCATVTGPAAGGDTGADRILGLTETWTYSCTSTLTATTTNVVTATGTDPLDADVSDQATATVTVIDPRIAIDKTPSATSVAPGTTVVYTYTVTNGGDVPLAAIVVTDDKCSPVSLINGDTNGDGILQLDETWVFRCSQVQTGAIDTLTNVGTAVGTDPLGLLVQATDTVTVSVVAPLVLAQPTPPAVVVPAPAATAPATLPRTGIDVSGWIQLGASLILLGVSLLVTARNQRRTA